MYRIQARVVVTVGPSSTSHGVPTFYVGEEQGCVTGEHAARVAASIVNPNGDSYVRVHLTAYDPETGDYYATPEGGC